MSYPQNYPQQPQGYGQQPQGYPPQQGYQQPQGYPRQQGYPQPQPGFYPPAEPPGRAASPATAAFAAVLGLLAAAALIVVNIGLFNDLSDAGLGLGDVPGAYTTIVVIRFGAAVVLLLGAVLVLARKVVAAVILAIGGLAGVAAVLLYPVLLSGVGPGAGDFGEYLKAVFTFDGTTSTFTAIALIVSPIVLILAVLPPTLNWLRSGRADAFAPPAHPAGW